MGTTHKKYCPKASFTSYQITKSFRTKNIWTLLKLYKSYVRPKLEYNTPVWSPYLSKDISLIENVQRRYTKIICRRCSIPFDSYSDRLIKLNLISLHSRRIRFDLIMLFKIVNNTSDLNFDSFFTIQHSPYSLRGNTSKVMPKQNFNCSVWRGSFFERAPRYWNRLSPEITCVKSLHLFKSKLNLINLENLIWLFSSCFLPLFSTYKIYIFYTVWFCYCLTWFSYCFHSLNFSVLCFFSCRYAMWVRRIQLIPGATTWH